MFKYSLIILSYFFISCQKTEVPTGPKVVVETHVAQIVEVRNLVEYRHHEQLDWNIANTNTKLNNFDFVKTGEKSFSKIVFNNYSMLNVEENTLVVVMDRVFSPIEEKQILSLSKGEVEGSVENAIRKNVSLEIRTPRGWVRTPKGEKSNFKVKVQEDKVEVNSIDGDVEIVTIDRQEKINKGTVVELTGAKVESKEGIISKLPPRVTINKVKVAEEKFEIYEPTKEILDNGTEIVIFNGVLEGATRAYLNGREVKAKKGKFLIKENLSLGLNVFTFQVIKSNGELANKVFKITRK